VSTALQLLVQQVFDDPAATGDLILAFVAGAHAEPSPMGRIAACFLQPCCNQTVRTVQACGRARRLDFRKFGFRCWPWRIGF
jgi:hypothetical protein